MAQYIHVGIFLITVSNLIIIILMLVIFALAVAQSLPQERTELADEVAHQAAELREERSR
jgi:hypothetical protein